MSKENQGDTPKRNPVIKKLGKLSKGQQESTSSSTVVEEVPEWLERLLVKYGEEPGPLIGLKEPDVPSHEVDPEESLQVSSVLAQMEAEGVSETSEDRAPTSVEWGSYQAEAEEPPPAIDELLTGFAEDQIQDIPDTIQEDDVPDWIAEGISDEPSSEPQQETAPDTSLEPVEDEPVEEQAEDDVPDWLSQIIPERSAPPPPSAVEEDNPPEWLASTLGEAKQQEPTNVAPIAAEQQEPPSTEEEDDDDDDDEIPDWLAAALDDSTADLSPEQASETPETEAHIPEWLFGMVDEPVSDDQAQAEEDVAEHPSSDTTDETIPDWLTEALGQSEDDQPTEQAAAIPPVSRGDAGDLTDAESPSIPDLAMAEFDDTDIPDWLAEETSEAKDDPSKPISDEEEIPDWLTEEEDLPESADFLMNAEAEDLDIPDWLTDEHQETVEGSEAEDEVNEVPDWLQIDTDLDDQDFGAETKDRSAEESSDDDWLAELRSSVSGDEIEFDDEPTDDIPEPEQRDRDSSSEEDSKAVSSDPTSVTPGDTDWLTSLSLPSDAELNAETEEPSPSARPGDTGWLRDLDLPPGAESETPAPETTMQSSLGDTGWLRDLDLPPGAESETSDFESDSLIDPGGTGWLRKLEDIPGTESDSTTTADTPSETSDEDDWLSNLRVSAEEERVPPVDIHAESRPESPLSTDVEAEFVDVDAEPSPGETDFSDSAQATLEEDTDLPDWLLEVPTETSDETSDVEEELAPPDVPSAPPGPVKDSSSLETDETEMQDWLSELRSSDVASEDIVVESELPDWLQESSTDQQELPPDSDLPDWLLGTPTETTSAQERSVETEAKAEGEGTKPAPELDIPDWLKDEPELPDWLADDEPEPPDWLRDLPDPDDAISPPPSSTAEVEIPDWLADLPEETDVDDTQSEFLYDEDADLPDWLADLPQTDTDAAPEGTEIGNYTQAADEDFASSWPDIDQVSRSEAGTPTEEEPEPDDSDLAQAGFLTAASILSSDIDEKGQEELDIPGWLDDLRQTDDEETLAIEPSTEATDELDVPAWLADLPDMSEEAEPPPELADLEIDLDSDSELEMPNWLSDLPEIDDTAAEAQPQSEQLPDELKSESPEVEPDIESAAETESDLEMQAWLTDTAPDSEETETLSTEAVTSEAIPQAPEEEPALPEWLTDLSDIAQQPDAATAEASEVESSFAALGAAGVESDLDVPLWLRELQQADEPEEAPQVEVADEASGEAATIEEVEADVTADEVDLEASEPEEDLEMPPWLSGLRHAAGEEAIAVEEIQPEEEMPVNVDEEAAAPASVEDTAAITDQEVLDMPDWLTDLPEDAEETDDLQADDIQDIEMDISPSELALPESEEVAPTAAQISEDSLGMPAWLADLPEIAEPSEEYQDEPPIDATFTEEAGADEIAPVEDTAGTEADVPAWLAGLREATGRNVDPSEFEHRAWELEEPEAADPTEASTSASIETVGTADAPAVTGESPEPIQPEALEPDAASEEAEAGDEAHAAEAADDDLVIPAWLGASATAAAVTQAGSPDEAHEAEVDLEADAEAPDWLAEFEEIEPVQESAAVEAESESDTPEWLAVDAGDGPDLPDWLLEPEIDEAKADVPDMGESSIEAVAVEPEQPELSIEQPSIDQEEDLPVDDSAEETEEVSEKTLEVPEWLAEGSIEDLETPEWLADTPSPQQEITQITSRVPDVPAASDWMASLRDSERDGEAEAGERAEQTAGEATASPLEGLFSDQSVPVDEDERAPEDVDDKDHREVLDGAPAEAAGMSTWLDALKSEEMPSSEEEEQETAEATGMLAGLGSLLPAERVITPTRTDDDQADDLQRAATEFQEIATQSPKPVRLPAPLSDRERWLGRGIKAGLLVLFVVLLAIPLLPAVRKVVGGNLVPWTEPSGSFSSVLDDQRRQLISEELGIIDTQQPGSVALVSFDYTPATQGEMQPLAEAVVGRLVGQGMRLIAISLEPEGAAMAQQTVEEVLAQRNQEDQYGVDVINLGYLPGQVAAVRELATGKEFSGLTDFESGATFSDLEQSDWQEVQDIGQINLIVTIADNPATVRWWIEQLEAAPQPEEGERYLLAATSAVAEPFLRPYRESDQLDGLISGISGAAAIEAVRNNFGPARGMLDSQSVAHLVIVILIAIGTMVGWMPKELSTVEESPSRTRSSEKEQPTNETAAPKESIVEEQD